jgi:type I restriction enzyme M protein
MLDNLDSRNNKYRRLCLSETGAKMQTICSVQDLLSHTSVRYFREARGRWIFRGLSDAQFELIPSVGRPNPGKLTREKYEQSLFDMFCREARGYFNSSSLPCDPWEWLSLAQHHGLPTRLIDWTHNPLVALYFAVNRHPERDGQLFALHSVIKQSERERTCSPFEITQAAKFYPNVITPRIRAQEGVFVVCAQLETALDQVLPDTWNVERLVIPSSIKKDLRYELFRLGIHTSSLFPGIGGLATRITWQHTVSPPKEIRELQPFAQAQTCRF